METNKRHPKYNCPEYFGVDFEIVWEIVSYKLPTFKLQIQQILVKISEKDI